MTALTVKRELAASPESVWKALTTADGLAGWMWPRVWNTTASVDLKVGGRYHFASVARGMGVSGEYVSIEAPERLVQTWRWDGDDEETLVTLTLEPSGEGTTLTLVHERFRSDEDRDNHLQGWQDCLDRLPDYLLS